MVTRHDRQVVDVPLAHTDVHLRVSGMLVDATVTQRFHNPYADKIEAVYLFPLPTGAAVDELVITSGSRTIRGQIQERVAAQRTYQAARGKGEVAALLTQERPNLFTQNLANLEPGADIDVTLHYVERLDYVDDGYELVFPMVAPPRYTPTTTNATPATPADAAALAPPTLPPATRSSAEISLEVELDAAVPIAQLGSPSHQLVIARPTPSTARIALAAGDTIPNKDFILRYRVAGPAPALGVLSDRDGDGDGSFVLVAQPPAADAPVAIAPRELLFVIDTSSSMRGAPLAKAKELVHRVLAGMRADDTFQIVRFDDRAAALATAPIANKPHNVELALRWVDQLEAGGTTEISAGLDTAFAQPHDPLRLRVVVLVGDGYVGDEDAIVARATAELGDARLFCFGVGSAVNRYLLEELARIGRGSLQVVRPDEDTTAATTAFARRIAAPVLGDITIDWGGLAVRDVTPSAVPDVFVGAPLVLAGHYAHGGRGTITVHGTQAGRAVSLALDVELADHDPSRPAVATVWARARIAELSRRLVRAADPAVVRDIVALSIASHVLTHYTAFVAVDESHTTGDAPARKVAVPVEVPDAVGGIAASSNNSTYGSIAGGIALDSAGAVGFGFSTIGHGAGGGGAGYGIGGGREGLRGRAADPDQIKLGKGTVTGELDVALIRRYLKRNLDKLRDCYDKARLATPGLAGTLMLEFTIDGTGHVIASAATGVDEAVSTCAAAVVGAIEFPKPSSSGLVQVHYPLQLSSAAEVQP